MPGFRIKRGMTEVGRYSAQMSEPGFQIEFGMTSRMSRKALAFIIPIRHTTIMKDYAVIAAELRSIFSGDIDSSEETLKLYSHDASLFELKPRLVVKPKHANDVAAVVRYIRDNKQQQPNLSLTARAAGTDMSGGAINDSIILDIRAHMNRIFEISSTNAHVQPGVFYRDLDLETIKVNAMLPSYPASRDLCTVGGMVANGSGGEKSLRYGKTDRYVTELDVVLSDGKCYKVAPLTKPELIKKMAQKDFEGQLYKQIFDLVEKNYDSIKAAKPRVSKDSTGYHLWDVWDRESGIFDLTKLIVGSQGTLGIVTDIHFRLVPRPTHSGVLVCFLKDISGLGNIINDVMEANPATFECFDDHTLWLSFKFFPQFIKKLGLKRWILLALQLIPDFFMLFRGIPKLILMIEFTGDTQKEVTEKIHAMRAKLAPHYHMAMEENETEFQAQKFWIMRRESFNLLRQKVKDKHTAPFIDDFVIPPPKLPEAWPRLRAIVKKYNLIATITGHIGDGNFHIIPLMEIEKQSERDKLLPAMKEVNELVLSYNGSISGEHNDGLVRGPWLPQMYGPEMFGHLRQVKTIFDPENIFNPHKKTDAHWEYSFEHIRRSF